MATCSFIGNRDTPSTIAPILESVLVDLIEKKNVSTFYVGNNGNFDFLVSKKLEYLKNKYPNIKYSIVFAYIPVKKTDYNFEDFSDTIYPDILENTPRKYAIIKRNEWMINKSDYVIVYAKNKFGNAMKFKEYAENKNKQIIEL